MQLSSFSVIAVKIRLWGTAGRAGAVFRDVAFLTSGDGFYLNTVPAFKVRNQETPVPFLLDDLDFGKFVYFELLIFWRMGIIESPLFEWYISADKTDQPAVLLIKILNNRESVLYNVHEHWLLSIMDVWSLTLYTKREVNALFIVDFP